MAGVYVGGTMGIGANQWECKGYIGCDRAAFSGKAFAGYRMTPGLAAEINYIYFGAVERSHDNNSATAAGTNVMADHQTTKAVTVGVNWEVELLHHFTNHLRIGMAFKRRDNELTYRSGATETLKTYDNAPYVGAGLSFRVNENVRLLSSFDYLIDGQQSNYLFSIGASAEF